MSRVWDLPLRVVQFLLRNVDAATESPRALVDAAADWGANAILLNGGGFSAWYPTRLDYQPPNAHMQGDFLGEAKRSPQLPRCTRSGCDVGSTVRSPPNGKCRRPALRGSTGGAATLKSSTNC
jgi:hypothetical protein